MSADISAATRAVATATPGLGIASFVIGICGFPLWILLGVAIGHQLSDLGGVHRKLVLVLGACVFLMLGLNAFAVVMGFIGGFRKDQRKTLSILGIALNAIQLFLMLLIVILGRGHPRSNQTLERTADRRDTLLSMTSTVKAEPELATVSGRSSCSR